MNERRNPIQAAWYFRLWLVKTGYAEPELLDTWTRNFINGTLDASFAKKFWKWFDEERRH